MRLFQLAIGGKVDLDDRETYKRLPQTVAEVMSLLYREIGYARLYMMARDCGNEQTKRVGELEREIAKQFGGNMYTMPLQFWQEKLFIFQDEIENMC